ncbi:MAG: stage II sporulation protein P [Veillonellales bacterium]
MLRLLFAALSVLWLLGTFPGFSVAASSVSWENQEIDDGYITAIDDSGIIILQTGLTVHPGDHYIDEANHLYEITAVEGRMAKARVLSGRAILFDEAVAVPAQAAPSRPIIAVYHTHTDESYIPTDGKASISGRGSIMLVGDALTSRLAELGFQTIHDKTLHEPHDANAYQRSRRTFLKLLKQQPATLFDLHRDSAPVAFYQTTINGQTAAKILLVVGQQNQNQATTLDYAKRIKAAADARYKSLIRGIFIARGNYNQDLNPRSMLLEIGTQYNTLQAAAYSATLFADVVPSFLPPGPAPDSAAAISGDSNPIPPAGMTDTAAGDAAGAAAEFPESTVHDLFFILAAFILGAIAYLYLSTGSWQEAKAKLARFRKYEFINFFGSRKKRKD